MKKSVNIEDYIHNHPDNKHELKKLRSILLNSELSETIKWGAPTYTVLGKNVVSMVGFKDYTSLWFHRGSFLTDPDKVLEATDNDMKKALRHWKFSNEKQIREKQIKPYIEEAILNEKRGLKKAPVKRELIIPEELLKAFEKDPGLKSDFQKLTSGKQREFADYVSGAKRELTRVRRLEKCRPLIREGKGLNDAYRK